MSEEGRIVRLSFPNSLKLEPASVKQLLARANFTLPLSYTRRSSFCLYVPLYEIHKSSTFTFDYLTFSSDSEARQAVAILEAHQFQADSRDVWSLLRIDVITENPRLVHSLCRIDNYERQRKHETSDTHPIQVLPTLTMPQVYFVNVCKHCSLASSECECPTIESYWCRHTGKRVDECNNSCDCQKVIFRS